MTDKQQPESVEPEDKEPNESSRRRFLLGAATLAAGAIAAEKAVAGDSCDRGLVIGTNGIPVRLFPPSREEATRFANAFVMATLSQDYRKRLLTFEEGASIRWADYSDKREEMLKETREALKDAGFDVDPKIDYVILSNDQFENQGYVMKSENELVRRLPDRLEISSSGGGMSLNDVKDSKIPRDALRAGAVDTLQARISGM